MTTVAGMALAFKKGLKRSHRSVTLRYPLGAPNEYILHGNIICYHYEDRRELAFHWCGWYGPTTAKHMNSVMKAFGVFGRRVGYAKARDFGETCFSVTY